MRGSRLGSSASTIRRASWTACGRSTFCSSRIRSGAASSCSCRPRRRPAASSAPTETSRRRPLEEAEAINARWGDGSYKPIVLSVRHHEPAEVFELFRAADLCIVSSLHDGMNLVAKEFVAARDDEQGVLVLSSFAGASRELSEALIVNPYDTHGMAEAIDLALRMTRRPARADAGDAGARSAAQRLSLGGPDAARRGPPEAAREHRRRGGGLSRAVDGARRVFSRGCTSIEQYLVLPGNALGPEVMLRPPY